MPDYSRPGQDGTEPSGQAFRSTVANTPEPTPMPCPSDTTCVATVRLTVPRCDILTGAHFAALYREAVALITAQLARRRCREDPGCREWVFEMGRAWGCGPNGGDTEAWVEVARRKFCRDTDPGGTWLTPAADATAFTAASGRLGTVPGDREDASDVRIGPDYAIACDGQWRNFRLTYDERAECAGITDYTPFVNRAQERMRDILSQIPCRDSCDAIDEITWSRWGCRDNRARVEITFRRRCVVHREEGEKKPGKGGGGKKGKGKGKKAG